MRQKRRKEIPMTNKTSKTSKSNQTQATANEEPHTTASVAEPGATVASSKAASKKVTSQKKKAAQGRRKATGKAAKPAKSAKAAAPSQPRQSRKKTDTPEAPQKSPCPEAREQRRATAGLDRSRAGCQPVRVAGLRFTLHLARMMRGILVYLALP